MFSHILTKRLTPFAKRFARFDHDTAGIPGSNLPFGIENKFALVVGFTIYTASGLTLPFYVAYYGMKKQ